MNDDYYVVRDEDGYESYVCKKKLPSNQTIKIEFQEDFVGDTAYYNIYLCIYSKRKHEDNNYSTLKRTGKDGLIGLLWAKQKILEFEKFIADKNKVSIIYCYWSDNHRRDVYWRGLKKCDYKMGILDGKKAIYKKIVSE